jgi:hypothetical protein
MPAVAVERPIRIERRQGQGWHTIPTGDKVRVWETSTATSDAGARLMLFHIGFMEGLAPGQRLSYAGEKFELLRVSESSRLVGLELQCAQVLAQSA